MTWGQIKNLLDNGNTVSPLALDQATQREMQRAVNRGEVVKRYDWAGFRGMAAVYIRADHPAANMLPKTLRGRVPSC